MKCFKQLLVILFLLCIAIPAAGEPVFQSDKDFYSFVSSFNENPQPDKIKDSLDYYLKSQYLNINPIMIASFYASLLRQDNQLLQTIFVEHLSDETEDAKIFIIRTLGEINTQQSTEHLQQAQKVWPEELIQNFLQEIQQTEYYDVMTNIPRNSSEMDKLWGIYFATGNKRAIDQIISVLHFWEDGRDAEVAIGGAAKWSLTSNAAQHPKVLKEIKNELTISSGIKKALLEEIVNSVQEKKAE